MAVAPQSRTARRMSDAAEDPFHEQGAAAAAAAPVKPVESAEEGVGLHPTSSSSSLSSSVNRDAASRASASSGTSAADPSSALMSTPSAATHPDDGDGEPEQPQPQPATAAYPFSADPYPQDEEAIKRHQARSAEREAEYQARQQQQEDAVTSPPLPQLPADHDDAPDGAAPKPRAQQQQQRVYQRPARDAIQVGRGTLSLWPPVPSLTTTSSNYRSSMLSRPARVPALLTSSTVSASR